MKTNNEIALGVNIDHIATLRQARLTRYPDPIQAAHLAEEAGADGITIHLREDRRHIQERDVKLLKETLSTRMNLEMAVIPEMLKFALDIKPEHCCLVPEKREELTTEGGLAVIGNEDKIRQACERLQDQGTEVSLFIDPDPLQIAAAHSTGAKAIELHTGHYANTIDVNSQQKELERLLEGAKIAHDLGLIVNAGHGLHYHNVKPIASIPYIYELNIGHAIIARAVITGLKEAVSNMKELMLSARIIGVSDVKH